jgi:hypothetical protein
VLDKIIFGSQPRDSSSCQVVKCFTCLMYVHNNTHLITSSSSLIAYKMIKYNSACRLTRHVGVQVQFVALGGFRRSKRHIRNQSQEWYAKTSPELLSLTVTLGQPLPDLLYATIDDLQSGLAAGTFTSVDLVKVLLLRFLSSIFTLAFQKAYVARIHEVNPLLHAVIETNPDALAIAASLDAERAGGSFRGYSSSSHIFLTLIILQKLTRYSNMHQRQHRNSR